ncbi:MAG: YhcH/YjgK/YiaL family protein [Oscillospiraceae bacterium]
MIYDLVENSARYDGVSPNLKKALQFLRETDFSALPDGRQEIDGDRVFANIMTFQTRAENDTPEGHRDYIDVQYPISGTEYIGVGQLRDATETVESHPERDIWLYHAPTENITIGEGRFVAVFPNDIHAPGIAIGNPATVRKCVVKVRV